MQPSSPPGSPQYHPQPQEPMQYQPTVPQQHAPPAAYATVPGQTIVMPPSGGTSGGAIAGIVVLVVVVVVAITVVLAGVLYVWASSLAGDSTGGGLDVFTFVDSDAYGDDDLVYIQMNSGPTDGLNWATVGITISVDGGTPHTCSEGTNTGSSCEYEPNQGGGNNYQWEVAEGITISGDCYDNYGCYVDVTITKMGAGSEDDKVIANVQAYADMTS